MMRPPHPDYIIDRTHRRPRLVLALTLLTALGICALVMLV